MRTGPSAAYPASSNGIAFTAVMILALRRHAPSSVEFMAYPAGARVLITAVPKNLRCYFKAPFLCKVFMLYTNE